MTRQWLQRIRRRLVWEISRRYQGLQTRRGGAERSQPNLREVQGYLASNHAVKVVLGAGGIDYDGWLSTDIPTLDITDPEDWRTHFQPNSIDRLLAEHVFEHLSETQNRVALDLCYRYLRSGGFVRIAVPDGNRRDQVYVEEVAPPKDGHQILFTLESLGAMLQESGFRVRPLEYFDASEQFHAKEWESSDGHVRRSVRYDNQVAFKRGNFYYTSLIVDAVKPQTGDDPLEASCR